ncbi:antibiotic biosynthesis monooxygenase [Maribacter polysiphoniae]|uniref:Antibiotic biosynthesis monooxygenase n=1 Tax=Maribacter polysiphoniae TaxID=429344 RepID=A0A316DMA7_9FLAO|nr:putative quinol monooxygenase [Maribacter polysiphoniae]MBD1263133.1 antibiotic biosynthesis monooxygenase [Maribacter polysiphoniae]PWK18369.1 quinol monooxygenase YgiN [Maribacter polysiphoniae]
MLTKKLGLLLVLLHLSLIGFGQSDDALKADIDQGKMMVRIAELEIGTDYLDEYLEILKEESEASLRLEPGVICIYPMFQKENPTQIRLLEIYANKEAYESHLKTPHFQMYKTTTAEMVKDLKLIDMKAIDPESMSMVFDKIN